MFRNQSRTDSAPSRGTIPQGKGREGIRKGMELWTEGLIHRFGSRGLARDDKRMGGYAALGRGVR